jgi:hypothetical protein
LLIFNGGDDDGGGGGGGNDRRRRVQTKPLVRHWTQETRRMGHNHHSISTFHLKFHRKQPSTPISVRILGGASLLARYIFATPYLSYITDWGFCFRVYA